MACARKRAKFGLDANSRVGTRDRPDPGPPARRRPYSAESANLDGNSQERVDLAAIEKNRLAGELPEAVLALDLVEIVTGGKNRHVAFLHCAHDKEIRHQIECILVV